MAEYIVAVDAMGGDNAPGAIVEGTIAALRQKSDIQALLFGREDAVNPLLAGADDVRGRITVVHAPDVISMHDAPMLAIRRMTGSSLVMAMMAVKEGRAQALVSAGSTGAILAGGMLRVGRIPGIDRPALNALIPGEKKPFLLLDCGANVDCQSDYLVQFGLMGSIYMEKVLGVKDPAVKLANIGSEAEKGNRLAKETYQKMAAQKEYHFGGNIEAVEIPRGEADVVVCDGFDGNLILKYTEGLSASLVHLLKAELLSSTRSKLGALLIKPALKKFKSRLSSEDYGGAPLLGVKGALIKVHGGARAGAVMHALFQARQMIEGDVVGLIEQGMSRIQTGQSGEEKEKDV